MSSLRMGPSDEQAPSTPNASIIRSRDPLKDIPLAPKIQSSVPHSNNDICFVPIPKIDCELIAWDADTFPQNRPQGRSRPSLAPRKSKYNFQVEQTAHLFSPVPSPEDGDLWASVVCPQVVRPTPRPCRPAGT